MSLVDLKAPTYIIVPSSLSSDTHSIIPLLIPMLSDTHIVPLLITISSDIHIIPLHCLLIPVVPFGKSVSLQFLPRLTGV